MDNQEILNELQAIALENGGRCSPLDVVKAAEDEQSVLHPYFTWDNDEAAEKFRVIQAGILIRRVKFTLVRYEGTEKEVSLKIRAFESIPSNRGDRSYEPIEAIMADEYKKEEHLLSILNAINSYRKKYARYQELDIVWNAVDEVYRKIAKPAQAAA
jgi:hypothetical protein